MVCRLLNRWDAYWTVFARHWCNEWGGSWGDNTAALLHRPPSTAKAESTWASAILTWQRLNWRPVGVPSHGAVLGSSLWLGPIGRATRSALKSHRPALTAMAESGVRHLGDLIDEGNRTWLSLADLSTAFPLLKQVQSRRGLQNGLHALITAITADGHIGAYYTSIALGPPTPPPCGSWWSEELAPDFTLIGKVASSRPCSHEQLHQGQGGFDVVIERYHQAPSGLWIPCVSMGVNSWGKAVMKADTYELCGYAEAGTEHGGVDSPGLPIRQSALSPWHWQAGLPSAPVTSRSSTRALRKGLQDLQRDTAAPLGLWAKKEPLVRGDVFTARIMELGFGWLRKGPYVAKAQEVAYLFWHSALYPRTEDNRRRRGVACDTCEAVRAPCYEEHLVTCPLLAGHWARLRLAFQRWWPGLRGVSEYRRGQSRPQGEVQFTGLDYGLPLVARRHYFWLWVITLHTAWTAKAAEFYGSVLSPAQLRFQQEEGWRTAAMVRWHRISGYLGPVQAKEDQEMQGWVRLDIGLTWQGTAARPRLALASGGRRDGWMGVDGLRE